MLRIFPGILPHGNEKEKERVILISNTEIALQINIR